MHAKYSKHFGCHCEHPATTWDGITCDCTTLVAMSLLVETWSVTVIPCTKGKLLPTSTLCYASSALKGWRWHRLFWISGLDLPKHSGKQTALNVACNRLQWSDSRCKKSQNVRCLIGTSSGKRRNCCQELQKSVKTSYVRPCGKDTRGCGECRYTHSAVKMYRLLNYCNLVFQLQY